MSEIPIDEELLEDLYGWIDQIPLSRAKKNITRDFSDGVLIAEVVKHYIPQLVELHNYAAANKVENKLTNWRLLNRKVFKKLGFQLTEDVLRSITACKLWAVEQMLMVLRRRIDRYLYEEQRENRLLSEQPEADQVNTGASPKQAGKSPRPGDLKGQTKAQSLQNLHQLAPPGGRQRGDMVPKLLVEEKEQEILAREETIQILNAKVRRLEHLLHLKDIRIDDLQGRLERLEQNMRPTANHTNPRPVKVGRK